MRLVLVLGVLAVARIGDADDAEDRRPARWQAASGAPALNRIWGADNDLYGVGSAGAYRSTDGGATWSPVDGAGPATGVWGTGSDDVWIVRARTLHHTHDGTNWTTQSLPMLSFGAAIEGMWGADRDRYVFGVDRVDGKPRGVILRSRDGGTSWRAESIPEVDRIAGIWGSAANDVYAVGAKGIVLHSTGEGWTTARQPTGSSLEGIWGASATSIYAVGANGTILHSTDGKAWSPRTSGVRYTLSSIVGRPGELYAGSSDGAPLRSTDGMTWKPVTALIARGHVWASDSHAVLASSNVQFLGEAPPVEPSPVQQVDDVVAHWKSKAEVFGAKYPAARDLMLVIAKDQGSYPPLPAHLRNPGRPQLAIGSISGCSPTIDKRGGARPTGGNQIIADLKCQVRCDADATPTISQTATAWIDGKSVASLSVSFDAPSGWCDGKLVERTIARDAILDSYYGEIQRRFDVAIAAAVLDDDRIDADARYVIAGGLQPEPRRELARLLKQPEDWYGLFWNRRTSPDFWVEPRASICSSPNAVADLENRAVTLMSQGNHGGAVAALDQIITCRPETVAPRLYLAACRAKNFPRARAAFQLLPVPQQASLAQVCKQDGFDPRRP